MTSQVGHTSNDSESNLALAYFATVMCAADSAGPLSESFLTKLAGATPAGMSRSMFKSKSRSKIEGYISLYC